MKKTIIWIVIIIIVIIGLIAWSNSGSAPVSAPMNDQTASSSDQVVVAPVVVLGSASSTALGAFLTGTNGMTLYRYTKDVVGTSTCNGQCAVIWPPYTVSASTTNLIAGDAGTGTVSTIIRTDGSSQITYNGLPLYFYNKDVKAGDTLGQNVGKVWFVVKP